MLAVSGGYSLAVTVSRKAADRLPVRLRLHRRLSPAVPGDVLVTASVGPAGEAVALWASPADRQALLARSRDGESPRSRPQRPVAARVSVHGTSPDTVVALDDLDVAFCQVQPLPDGRVLVVGARNRAGGANALVFDAAGQRISQARVGDGIEHVLTTPTGRIWVGYFDEGVFGDDPVAHHGIVRFSDGLEPDWTYPFDAGYGSVDDCYALNVDQETAWAYYYSDFPVVRIADGAVIGWRTQTAGAKALLVESDTCALAGGYGPDHDRLVVGCLAGDRYEPIGDLRLTLPDGQPLPPGSRILGRGADLHLFNGGVWYRLSLPDVI